MKFYIILSLILFSLTTAHSQEKEYLVTNNNDTIYGKIIRGTNYLNPSKIVFKIKTEQGKKTKINPSEVKIIRSLKGVDGNCIIRTVYNQIFIKEIINGRIKVFVNISTPLFYISKDGGEIEFADFGGFGSRKKVHSQIRTLVKDSPEILKEFDSLKGTRKNIMYIIEKYNNAEKKLLPTKVTVAQPIKSR